MTPFVILPVKPLATGKSRLAEVMTEAERRDFNRRLAEHTIDVVASAVGPEHTVVVSRDETVLDFALQRRAVTLFEPRGAGLNPGLDHAQAEAIRLGADAVLIVPVDLPLLDAADIEALVAAARGERAVVVAPDRKEAGTNALLLVPPGLIPFAFGPGSLEAHRAAAREAGLEPVIVRREALAFDVDTAEDHALLQQAGFRPDAG